MTRSLNDIFIADAEQKLGKAKSLVQLSNLWRPYTENNGLALLDAETKARLMAVYERAQLYASGGIA